MISIVVSSYQKHYFEAFSKNVGETIGVPYEIIQIWNPGLMGICKAYNQGAYQSKFENLLFVHEDVLFESIDWGNKLLNHLNLSKTGIVGLAGADYVPNCPSGWHFDESVMFRNLIQSDENRTQHKRLNSEKKQVYSLDGVFLGVRKDIFNKYKFNENLKNFHGYDIDFSIRISNEYENYVIDDILLIHFSKGGFSKDLVQARIIARRNYLINQNQLNNQLIEIKALNIFINDLNRSGFTKFELIKNVLPYLSVSKLGFKNVLRKLKQIILS